MRACITCGQDKADDAFRKFGRGLKKTCRDCEGGGSVKAASSRVEKQEAPPPVTITASLEVPAGLGFRASIEDSALVIEQDRADETGDVYTHTITLSSKEAALVVDWIAAQVQQS
jgi:hypothetical protein